MLMAVNKAVDENGRRQDEELQVGQTHANVGGAHSIDHSQVATCVHKGNCKHECIRGERESEREREKRERRTWIVTTGEAFAESGSRQQITLPHHREVTRGRLDARYSFK